MRNGNILMHSKINLFHRRRCITFVVPFLVEIHMPILYSTEKDEGGFPLRVGNAAIQMQLKRRTP